jgi:N utilization substance protein B
MLAVMEAFPPQKFREIIFQLIFSFDMGGEMEAELIPFFMRELAVSKKHVSAAYFKAQTVWQQCEEIDRLIAGHAKGYTFERIKTVEKNVLRLAFYELLVEKKLDIKIILAEAHRLTRKFSALEGAAFVNAVLQSLVEYLGVQDASSLPSLQREAAV